jgi:hypothetical protein
MCATYIELIISCQQKNGNQFQFTLFDKFNSHLRISYTNWRLENQRECLKGKKEPYMIHIYIFTHNKCIFSSKLKRNWDKFVSGISHYLQKQKARQSKSNTRTKLGVATSLLYQQTEEQKYAFFLREYHTIKEGRTYKRVEEIYVHPLQSHLNMEEC